MHSIVVTIEDKKIIISNLIALVIIYISTALSHLLPIPLYLLDPMRLMIIFSLFYTSKINSLVLCITLPLFSYTVAGHPALIKSLLIIFELILNISMLSYFINKRMVYFGIFASIIMSKLIYYSMKLICIKLDLIHGNLISTPFFYQFLTLLLIGIIVSIFLFRNNKYAC